MTRTGLIKSLLVSCLFFVLFGISITNASAAPKLYFDPANSNPTKNTDFQVSVKIDVGSQSAFGADAIINFQANDITVKSVKNGDFFNDFSYAPSSGKLELHGYFSALYASKTGSGVFATLTLNSNKDSGSGSLSIACSADGSQSEILDTNGHNILDCGSINQLNLTYSAGGGLPPGYSTPNSCGGTCGSNYNCAAPLYCYQGFCRNTNCPNDLTCGCLATPTPTPKPKPKSTLTPTAKPTPEIVILEKATPYPTSTPIANTPAPIIPQTHQNFGFLLWIAAISFALAIILLIFFL